MCRTLMGRSSWVDAELEEEQGLASGSGLSWLPQPHDFEAFDAAEVGEPPGKGKKARPARTEDAGEQGKKKRGSKRKPSGKDSLPGDDK